MNLPGYSPDFNADEAIWGWARAEATGNLCLGSRAAVQERVGKFLAGLSSRKDEVRRRCRTVLQSRAETLPRDSRPDSPAPGKCTSHLGFGLESGSTSEGPHFYCIECSISVLFLGQEAACPMCGSADFVELLR